MHRHEHSGPGGQTRRDLLPKGPPGLVAVLADGGQAAAHAACGIHIEGDHGDALHRFEDGGVERCWMRYAEGQAVVSLGKRAPDHGILLGEVHVGGAVEGAPHLHCLGSVLHASLDRPKKGLSHARRDKGESQYLLVEPRHRLHPFPGSRLCPGAVVHIIANWKGKERGWARPMDERGACGATS